MAATTRAKAAGYHGIQNMQFAKKDGGTYASSLLPMKYAKNFNPSAVMEATEQYSDNRLLFRVPNDRGYEGDIGTVAPDPELEKAAGYAIEGAGGLIGTSMAAYMRGALYYEFIEVDENGKPSVVKAWMFNVEIGKGAATHATDTKSVEFGEYKYPFTCYGDPLKDTAGTADWKDANGLGRTAFIFTARPSDTGYATFGNTVPVPKAAATV